MAEDYALILTGQPDVRAVLTKLEKLAVKEAQIVNAATYALVREGR